MSGFSTEGLSRDGERAARTIVATLREVLQREPEARSCVFVAAAEWSTSLPRLVLVVRLVDDALYAMDNPTLAWCMSQQLDLAGFTIERESTTRALVFKKKKGQHRDE